MLIYVALIFIMFQCVVVFACALQDNKQSFMLLLTTVAPHTVLCPNMRWLTLQTSKKFTLGSQCSSIALFLAMTRCNC